MLAYPKSGSNLVLATLQETTKKPVQQWQKTGTKCINKFNHLQATIDSEKMPIFKLHSHKLEKRLLNRIDTCRNKLVLLVRNPKECITSHFQYNEDELVDAIVNEKAPFKDYINTLLAYDNWQEPTLSLFNWYPTPSKMIVFYEDLLENPKETFASLFNFLGENTSVDEDFFQNFDKVSNQILESYEKKYFKKIAVPTEVIQKGVEKTVNKMKLVFSRSSSRGKNTSFHTEHFSKESLEKIDDHLKTNYPMLWEKYLSRYSS